MRPLSRGILGLLRAHGFDELYGKAEIAARFPSAAAVPS
jgi:hypothetical protein